MAKTIKIFLLSAYLYMMIIWNIIWFVWYKQEVHAIPNFQQDFVEGVTQWDERVYNPSIFGIDTTKSFMDNIKNMFYPTDIWWGRLWNIIQYLWVWLFVGMIIRSGIMFLMNSDNSDKLKNAQNSMLYLAYGWFLFFAGAALINLLLVWDGDGSWSSALVSNVQNRLLLNVVAVLKSIAFFVAVIMVIRYGIKIIQSYDKEDKMKTGITGIINILIALVFIKVLDYIYLIAQEQDFKSRFVDSIVSVSKVIWYIIWWAMILYLIYAGFQMILSNGNPERSKKARNTIKAIFVWAIVIFLFLMIVFTLIRDLW